MVLAKLLVVFGLVGASYQAGLGSDIVDVVKEFMNFMKDYGKSYKDNAEKQARMATFKENLKEIIELRKLGHTGLGVTKFADWTKEERQKVNGLKLDSTHIPSTGSIPPFPPARSKRQVSSFSWVDQGKVTPVKDQGQCGSCWTYATAAVVESAALRFQGTSLDLSEQELVNCATGNACNGGDSRNAIVYARTKGMATEAAYPYTGTAGICKNVTTGKTYVTDWWYAGDDEAQLVNVLQQNGPLVIYMQVPTSFFYLTKDYDVYQPNTTECQNGQSTNGLHAMIIVGFGTSSISGKPYWLVKNSWGTNWGNGGYFKLYRGVKTCFASPYFFSVSTNADLKWTCANQAEEAFSCKYWQNLGYCNSNSSYYSYVTGQCPAACGLCAASGK